MADEKFKPSGAQRRLLHVLLTHAEGEAQLYPLKPMELRLLELADKGLLEVRVTEVGAEALAETYQFGEELEFDGDGMGEGRDRSRR